MFREVCYKLDALTNLKFEPDNSMKTLNIKIVDDKS